MLTKRSWKQAGSGNFVEAKISQDSKSILVRDNSQPEYVIAFAYDAWRIFVNKVKQGRFDAP